MPVAVNDKQQFLSVGLEQTVDFFSVAALSDIVFFYVC